MSHKIFEKNSNAFDRHCKSNDIPPKKDKGYDEYYLKVGSIACLNVPKVHPNLKYQVKGKVPFALK